MPIDAVTSGATVLMPEAAATEFLHSLSKPAHVLVAVSGGSDSTGLLIALAERLKSHPHKDITLSAATIDHGLRAAAADEAREVAAFCASRGIPHFVRRWEGEKPETGIMAAAREARYGLLADLASDISADVIVTAHTLDDQRETMAMRSARRGQGGHGTGIADAVLFDRRIWIVRPFLACRRADIRTFLGRHGLSWFDDPSNEDIKYERVRTRRDLQAEPMAGVPVDIGADRAALSERAAAWLDDWVTIHAQASCVIDRAGLSADRAAVAYALSYLAAVFGGKAYAPGHVQMERVLEFVNSASPGRRTAGGVVFDLRRDGLYLMRESRNIAPLRLLPGEKGIWDGRFEISNSGNAPVRIVAAGTENMIIFPATMPKGVVLRARAAMPLAVTEGEAKAAAVTVVPYLAPFDRFLTRFDLTFANRLSAAFGREAYMRLPLSVL
ncbi:tRNA(Ile)-lysidine synthase [Rhizobium dioscoreae]|uniref:tRNA(Ile)-lysidine synthase n=1 Tax=Rhizobium dioscoreae TaxID=2653122 RepID=A0ABQ0YX53_9HYPH|nr:MULTISPECIES: tRNA lysidine(34) synthetase TilS [Rhizobium]GES44307.1 tRNA(Ile)-lysidine synthase [Rhizobium dioscoreae]GES47706.1 tRNA(Ile)-lysidine synthase [Rhizobium dioscoreae]GLU79828.1 tRNA(Ile)-lysidine synthase [Rhizobium sp. NBRC 114257]